MIKRSEFQDTLKKIINYDQISIDTETTGLKVWQKDRLFSIIIATEYDQYYFNFNQYPKMDNELLLGKEHLEELAHYFFSTTQTVFFANAKFDLAALFREGIEVRGDCIDVLVLARLIHNDHFEYSLAACAEREGLKKDDAVEDYISKEGLWEWEIIPGKKQRGKNKFFNKVPPDIIVPYGKKDAAITYSLGKVYLARLSLLSVQTPKHLPNINAVLRNEIELTKVCFEMEKVGVQIDRGYCEEQANKETEKCREARERFREICGKAFVDSNKALSEIFASYGVTGLKTEKGNPSFTESSLQAIIKAPHETAKQIARCVLIHRESYKKAATYYQSFLYYSDGASVLHANIKQAGTTTGRFSYSNPNLQNIPKEEDEGGASEIRKAFVPREGFCFVEFDYKAMEYRLMAEYAAEKELTERINKGEDVHEATAQMMGVKRNFAKTLNFMLLYGGGSQKLADSLGMNLQDAVELKARYFSALPKVKDFIWEVTRVTKERGFVFNWLGRRCHFPNKDFAYKGPNALIQGGCADIVKVAMVELKKRFDYLFTKSRMLVQVHDSILFEIHSSEFYVIPHIKEILEDVFPAKHLKMEVSCAHSWKSWGELVDGEPVEILHFTDVSKARNHFQEQNTP